MKTLIPTLLLPLLALCNSCSHHISQGQEVEASSITLKNGQESYALFREVTPLGQDYQMTYHHYPRDYNGRTQTTTLGNLSIEEMQPIFTLIRQFEASSFTPVLQVAKQGEPPIPFDQELELLLHGSRYAYNGQAPQLRESYAELLRLMQGYMQKSKDSGSDHTHYQKPR